MNTRVAGKTVLTIILAGGQGSRLSPLTGVRAKPAVPFLGAYAIIDFTLSNVMHSGLGDVWMVVQYLPHDLERHLAGGRPWDLDRTHGGLRIMPPFTGPDGDPEFAEGNAHALALHAELIEEANPDLVLVLSADHIYRLDYTPVIEEHVRRGAAVTLVTTEVPREEAGRYGNVRADDSGRVTDFAYKPDRPLGGTVTAEVFVYDTPELLRHLRELQAAGTLGDYGEHLLPRLVAEGRAYANPLPGYWRDVGTVPAYFGSHQDFLRGEGLRPDPRWPVHTSVAPHLPARLSGEVTESMVCGGAEVRGFVARSLVGPGAVVEAGAEVRDSLLLPGAVVRQGARVSRAILDAGSVVGAGAVFGGQSANARLSVLGSEARVQGGAQVGPGLHVAPGRRVRTGEEERTALPEDNPTH